MSSNFGVRSDLIDRLLNTRIKYYGTKTEKRDWARRKLRSMQLRHAIKRRRQRKEEKKLTGPENNND